LVGILKDDDADIRKAVVTAFGNSEESYVETQLQYCLFHEKDTKMSKAAGEALTKVKESGR